MNFIRRKTKKIPFLVFCRIFYIEHDTSIFYVNRYQLHINNKKLVYKKNTRIKLQREIFKMHTEELSLFLRKNYTFDNIFMNRKRNTYFNEIFI